jgi:(p)ppGpp synthase/HD superfamily hydrolase
MFSRSDVSTEVPTSSAERRGSRARRPGKAGPAASDHGAHLAPTALAYAARCHLGQRREGDGAPFVEHLSEVARLLRASGCSDVVVAAGLLHGVVQDTDVGPAELTARFGPDVVALVLATTDNSVGSYPQRKEALRDQVHRAGSDAALVFAAMEIAEVRELADEVRRERARAVAPAASNAARERYRQLCLAHHRASKAMLDGVVPGHRLVRQLADELASFPVVIRAARRRAL